MQSFLYRYRNRALAAAGETGEPECDPFLAKAVESVCASYFAVVPHYVGRFLFCHVVH